MLSLAHVTASALGGSGCPDTRRSQLSIVLSHPCCLGTLPYIHHGSCWHAPSNPLLLVLHDRT
jgi:hypothetical protein